jgi:hypothetical protein
MKAIKNILVGFLVSFVGSIPLGYLNIIGFQIYTDFGIENLVLYLLGVVSIEAFVIYFTLIFANRLVNNIKLMRVIDVFGVFFLLFLAYSFYSYSNQTAASPNYLEKYMIYSPFLVGLLLSGINFMQLPFWTGWNLYLINGNYITTTNTLKFYYVGGTLAGTFAGMIGFVFFLHTIAQNGAHLSKYLFAVIIPLIFIVLACLQGFKVFTKYIRKP